MRLIVLVLAVCGQTLALASDSSSALPACGDVPPGSPLVWNAPPDRTCAPKSATSYTPRFKGLAYEILALESENCGVPDDAYRLLDEIIQTCLDRISKQQAAAGLDERAVARLAGRTIGDVLNEFGFALHIPTVTLADALEVRDSMREPLKHIVDCDTSSFILITLAEQLGLTARLVEMSYSEDASHNYVRWMFKDGTQLDWDTNGHAECITPHLERPWQGRSMTRDQVLGYVLFIRAGRRKLKEDFDGAASDHLKSIRLYPENPLASNNFAWLIATREFGTRQTYRALALDEARRAVKVWPIPNYLDTLGCAEAFAGNWSQARRAIDRAHQKLGRREFQDRLDRFARKQDCTGLN